jgi:hypothetical protein
MSGDAMTRARRTLNGLAVAFAVAGLLALSWPVRLPTASAGGVPALPGAGAGARAAPDTGLAQTIVAENMFSSARRPPASRYVPSRDDVAPTVVSDAGTVMPSDTAAVPSGDPVPHLYGTIVGPEGPQALLRLDASIAEPRLYRVGDRAGGFRVDSIGERDVTLAGPRGKVVLRLNSPEDRAR